MALEQTECCNNCGKDYSIHHDRCPKCSMYREEDVEEFNKFIEEDDALGEREFMRNESKHRKLTEDEKIIYCL